MELTGRRTSAVGERGESIHDDGTGQPRRRWRGRSPAFQTARAPTRTSATRCRIQSSSLPVIHWQYTRTLTLKDVQFVFPLALSSSRLCLRRGCLLSPSNFFLVTDSEATGMAIPTTAIRKGMIILLTYGFFVSYVSGKLYVSMLCRVCVALRMIYSLLLFRGHGARGRDNLDCRTEPDNFVEGR